MPIFYVFKANFTAESNKTVLKLANTSTTILTLQSIALILFTDLSSFCSTAVSNKLLFPRQKLPVITAYMHGLYKSRFMTQNPSFHI
jgi:hypothetical protein